MSISGRTTKKTSGRIVRKTDRKKVSHSLSHFDAGLFKILFKDFLLESYQIKKKNTNFFAILFSLSFTQKLQTTIRNNSMSLLFGRMDFFIAAKPTNTLFSIILTPIQSNLDCLPAIPMKTCETVITWKSRDFHGNASIS